LTIFIVHDLSVQGARLLKINYNGSNRVRGQGVVSTVVALTFTNVVKMGAGMANPDFVFMLFARVWFGTVG
jgi:hypothetical protein